MPQGRPLKQDEINLIKKLIHEGLPISRIHERTGYGTSSINRVKAVMEGERICRRSANSLYRCPMHGDKK